MQKLLALPIILAGLFLEPAFGQNSIIQSFERGARLADDQATANAQRELLRAQTELLRAQTRQVQQQSVTYSNEEIQAAFTRLSQRYADWKQYEPKMTTLNALLTPSKGLLAYDYVLSLYLLAKQKAIEEKADSEVSTTIVEFTKQYPDWKQYEQAMLRLGETRLPENNETDSQYMKRLYDLAKQARP